MKLTEKDFREIYEKVPRLCVDIIIKKRRWDFVILAFN